MKIGNTAPDFKLKDGEGNDWTLSNYKGRTVVLLFYPGDNTPVCTAQLCSVRAHWSEYQATGAEVVGISTDTVESHQDFAEKNQLPLRLLSDGDRKVSEMYDMKSGFPAARHAAWLSSTVTVRSPITKRSRSAYSNPRMTMYSPQYCLLRACDKIFVWLYLVTNLNVPVAGRKTNRLVTLRSRPSLGRQIGEEMCQNCWAEWQEKQKQLINHFGLDVSNPDSHQFLFDNMKIFFYNEGVELTQIDTSQEGKVNW